MYTGRKKKEYPDLTGRRETALAHGLVGWASCFAGSAVPEGFGRGMGKIGKVLGILATPEKLQAMDI